MLADIETFYEPGEWRVIRIDTHSNPFVIREKLSEKFARMMVEKLEENVHKQGYWAELPQPKPPILGH